MMWTRWRGTKASRRAFLGGAGAMITLPWLPSLNRVALANEDAPTRLLYWYVPNGMHMPDWTPTIEGTGYDLPAILAPLEGIQQHVSVLTGLTNYGGVDDRPGDHARGTAAFLSCMRPSFEGVTNGISVDQIAANELGGETPFRSLQLGTESGGVVGTCDSGYSCAYTRNISWAGPSSPLPKQTSPQSVFDRLFAGYDTGLTDAERARRRVYRTSVLDTITEDAQTLNASLAVEDRLRVEQYLTGVRELELRIANATDTCAPPSRPPQRMGIEQHIDLMSDLTVVALECDLTRYLTFMLGNAGSNRTYGFIGASGAHHEISHHQDRPENFDKLRTIGTWEIERFSYLLRRMQAVQEGEGTLLDHSLVLLGSEISDGNRHNHDDLPVLLAGSGRGSVTPGRHIRYQERPIADLYLAMLSFVGIEHDTFGLDGTAPLANLRTDAG